MTENELQQKRKEYRDQEVMNKISEYSAASEYRQQTLKANYTHKIVDKRIGKLGWTIVVTQATFLVFFSLMFVFSYIPHTKFIVQKIMP
jgi:hypothetical protein